MQLDKQRQAYATPAYLRLDSLTVTDEEAEGDERVMILRHIGVSDTGKVAYQSIRCHFYRIEVDVDRDRGGPQRFNLEH